MRRDPTFSGADIIRMWTENLTAKEQDEVRCFFLVVEMGIKGTSRGLTLLLRLLSLAFPSGKIVFKLAGDIIEGLAEAQTAAQCLAKLKLKPEKEVI